MIFTPFIFDPRLVNPSSGDRYGIPRDTFFLLGCVLLVALWIIRGIWRQERGLGLRAKGLELKDWFHKHPLFTLWEGSLGVLLILALISLAFTTTLPLSLAALQSLFLGSLFYFALSRSLSFSHLTLLLRVQVLTTGVVGLHCLLQYHGIEPLAWFFTGTVNTNSAGIGVGYIGNTSHTSAYLAGAVPLGLALIWASPSPILRVILAVGTTLAAVGLFTTGGRGGLAGLVCGLGLLVALSGAKDLGLRAKGQRVFRPKPFLLLALLALIGWLSFPWIQTTPTWQKVYASWQRIAQGEWEQGLGTRPYYWRIAWVMVKEHPLTGTGIGSFARNIGSYKIRLNERDPTLEGIHDRAHNEFLQVWAEMGTPAFLVALTGVLSLLAWGVGVSRRKEFPNSNFEIRNANWVATGLTASLATILFTSLVDFVFHLSVTALPAILCAAGLAVYGLQFSVYGERGEGEQSTVNSRGPQTADCGPRSAVSRRPSALGWSRLTLSFCIAALALFLASQVLRPLRGLYAENRGDLLLYLAEKRKVPEDKLPFLFAAAEQAYRRAIAIYPHSAVAYLGLGYAQLRQWKYEEGIANVKKVLKYVETGETYSLLGEAYFETGDLKAAEEAFEKSLKLRNTGEASEWLEKVRAASKPSP